jgi:tetratricopeptide (TPR) repeat protein
MFEPDRIRSILALEQARYPMLLSDARSAGTLFDMNAAEQRIVNLIDGARSTQEIIAQAQQASSRDGVCAVLAAVVQTGVVELSVAPVRLQVEPSPNGAGQARPVAIGAIALKKTAQALPEKVSAPLDPAVNARAASSAARLAGEEAFQKGRRLLDRGQADQALIELSRAASFCTESTEYGLARDWAKFLVSAKGEESQSTKLAALKQTASEAVKRDPSFAFGFLVLGRVASLEGFDRHSIRFFRQAVQLDPSMVEAERYLRVLTLRAPRSESSSESNTARKRTSSPQKPTGVERLKHMIKDVVAKVRMPTPDAPAPQEEASTQPGAPRSPDRPRG